MKETQQTMSNHWEPPKLTDRCGRHFLYRDFIECSDTWHLNNQSGKHLANMPEQPRTWLALLKICETVLDPVVDNFAPNPLKFTYAFVTTELDKEVRGRERPEGETPNTTRNGDQHAGYELTTRGNRICSRLGIAVDFAVEGVGSKVVAQWIEKNTPFDRLYYYGDSKPVHVSIGPEEKGYRWNHEKKQ